MRATIHETKGQHPSIFIGLLEHFQCQYVPHAALAEEVFQGFNVVLLVWLDPTHTQLRVYADGAPARLLEDARGAFPDIEDIAPCLAAYCSGEHVDVYRATNVLSLITKLGQANLLTG